MRNTRKVRNRSNLGSVILIILAISIAFGFVFDFVVTKIEYAVYPKPDEYVGYIEKYSVEYSVPEELIWAVVKTESGFDSSAVSDVGAVGLMQLMPDTFEEITTYRLKEGLDIGMRYDPETNIRYGTYYLSYLYGQYGDWDKVIAAYNWGLGNLNEWLESGHSTEDITVKETSNYLKKVNKAKEKYMKLYN